MAALHSTHTRAAFANATRRPSRRVCMSICAAASSRRVLITGGNTGIGYETAKSLLGKGYEVVLACKDAQRASGAVSKLKTEVPGATVSSVPLDLGNLRSVRDCAAQLNDQEPFDVVLNNAGVMATPKMQTSDGFEFQLGINHLGHYALTNLILPRLIESKKPVRIINVSSMAHTTGSMRFEDLFRDKPGAYNAWEAYGQSKLANVLFTYELARKLQTEPQITVNTLHPGVVRTELGRYMVDDSNKWLMATLIAAAFVFFKSPEQGAQTSIYLASSPEVANMSGKYWVDCKPRLSSPASYQAEVARRLWEVSSELTDVSLVLPAAAPVAAKV